MESLETAKAAAPDSAPKTVLGQDDLCTMLNISRTTLWKILKVNPDFPKGRKLTRTRRVWYKPDIVNWLSGQGNEGAGSNGNATAN